MDTWLKGGPERERLFASFSSSYRIFKMMDGTNRVAFIIEDVDLEKMQAAMAAPETEAGMKTHTVILPAEVYIEIEGGK